MDAGAGGGCPAKEFGDAWRVGDGDGRPVVSRDCVGDFVAQGWSLPGRWYLRGRLVQVAS